MNELSLKKLSLGIFSKQVIVVTLCNK